MLISGSSATGATVQGAPLRFTYESLTGTCLAMPRADRGGSKRWTFSETDLFRQS